MKECTMKNKANSKTQRTAMNTERIPAEDDFFDQCVQKGLIEKTSSGYYFTPEFFKILKIN